MTDKDREAFEAQYCEIYPEHELRLQCGNDGNSVLYSTEQATQAYYAFKRGIALTRAHYAPKLTENEALKIARKALTASDRFGVDMLNDVIAALKAAGVQFRDEPNPEPGACQ
jgi:uncharacterized protein (DUF1501 family)